MPNLACSISLRIILWSIIMGSTQRGWYHCDAATAASKGVFPCYSVWNWRVFRAEGSRWGSCVPSGSLIPGKLLAVQIAKNKNTPDDDIESVKADYVYCVKGLARYADVIVVNTSCPNNGSWQNVEPLRNILASVVEVAKTVNRKMKPAMMVKVSFSKRYWHHQIEAMTGQPRRRLQRPGAGNLVRRVFLVKT